MVHQSASVEQPQAMGQGLISSSSQSMNGDSTRCINEDERFTFILIIFFLLYFFSTLVIHYSGMRLLQTNILTSGLHCKTSNSVLLHWSENITPSPAGNIDHRAYFVRLFVLWSTDLSERGGPVKV